MTEPRNPLDLPPDDYSAPVPEYQHHDDASIDALASVDLADLMQAEPEPVLYLVELWLPRRHLTLCGGHGGIGKTYFALTMGCHVAAGVNFAGLSVERDRVVFVSLEDEPQVMRLRLRRLIEQYGLDPGVILENFTLLDGTQSFAALVTEGEGHNAAVIPTATYAALREKVQGAGLIIIDNASDAFDANENSRRAVRTFIRSLTAIARENNAAVVLLAHIDKQSAKNGAQGNSYSGSTAWHNSSRSRLALLAQDDGALVVEHEKSNMGRKAEPVRFTLTENGIPIPEPHRYADAGQSNSFDRDQIILAFQAAASAGLAIPANLTPGAHSAMNTLANLPEFPRKYLTDRKGRMQAAQLLTAMKRAGVLVEETYTKANRHKAQCLLLAPAYASPICADPVAPATGSDAKEAESDPGKSALRHPLVPPCASTRTGGACVNAPMVEEQERRTIDASTQIRPVNPGTNKASDKSNARAEL
jgi:KaiC/GvpD/RAD55 family RecA-like ATPase